MDMCLQHKLRYLWQFMFNAFEQFWGKMTDVDTLQPQFFLTPLINKSLYDVMGFETDSYMLSTAKCCGLAPFKTAELKTLPIRLNSVHSSRFL